MTTFNTEIWDQGLLSTRNSSKRSLLYTPDSNSNAQSESSKKPGIMYRIFHLGDGTPTEGDHLGLWGRSRRSYGSASDTESSDDESDGKKSILEQKDYNSSSYSSKSGPNSKKGVFSLGMEESSEYESDPEDLPKKSKTSIFNGLLSGGKKTKSQNSSPTNSSRNSIPEDEKEPHGIFKDLLSTRKKNVSKDSGGSNSHSKSPFSSLSRLPEKPMTEPVELGRRLSATSMQKSNSETSLDEKYGKPEDVLGKGAYAVVKLCCPMGSKTKFAVKEFRKKRKEETQKEYVKKLMSEFCISSSLENDNVVKTVDLIQDSKKQWCVVMEYCAGGDLYCRISKGGISHAETNCYFVQLLRGVQYLHKNGVAHRDLKPENLLLDATHRILKITDFGVSEVFKSPFASKCKLLKGVAGSGPYIAPEEFGKQEYDSEKVDVWSIGVIFYVMLSNSIPWKSAESSDPRFKIYLDSLNNFMLFEKYAPPVKEVLYSLLKIDPKKRWSVSETLENPWVKSICVCTPKNVDYVDHEHKA